jgi:DNA-directed RNA polymerase specialized sigma24 family protein
MADAPWSPFTEEHMSTIKVSDVIEAPQPAADESAEEIHRSLYEAVAKLNLGAAQVLILRYVHKSSIAAIATLLGTHRG